MGALALDSENVALVKSVEQMLGLFAGKLGGKFALWQSRLQEAPESLGEIEQEVQAAFAEGAGMITGGLLAGLFASQELVGVPGVRCTDESQEASV